MYSYIYIYMYIGNQTKHVGDPEYPGTVLVSQIWEEQHWIQTTSSSALIKAL